MPRGKLKETTKRKRVLDQVSDWFQEAGAELDLPTEAIEKAGEEPAESVLEKIKEAEACLIFFNTKGSQFKRKICKTCEETFAYRWEVDSITRCSVECYQIALEADGLKWNPNKPQSERWGPAAPVVVPPEALKILEERISSLEDRPSDIPPEVTQ